MKRPKTFKLRISLENAAFEDEERELQRILRGLAGKIGNHKEPGDGAVRDFNGNKVGSWSLK